MFDLHPKRISAFGFGLRGRRQDRLGRRRRERPPLPRARPAHHAARRGGQGGTPRATQGTDPGAPRSRSRGCGRWEQLAARGRFPHGGGEQREMRSACSRPRSPAAPRSIPSRCVSSCWTATGWISRRPSKAGSRGSATAARCPNCRRRSRDSRLGCISRRRRGWLIRSLSLRRQCRSEARQSSPRRARAQAQNPGGA